MRIPYVKWSVIISRNYFTIFIMFFLFFRRTSLSLTGLSSRHRKKYFNSELKNDSALPNIICLTTRDIWTSIAKSDEISHFFFFLIQCSQNHAIRIYYVKSCLKTIPSGELESEKKPCHRHMKMRSNKPTEITQCVQQLSSYIVKNYICIVC